MILAASSLFNCTHIYAFPTDSASSPSTQVTFPLGRLCVCALCYVTIRAQASFTELSTATGRTGDRKNSGCSAKQASRREKIEKARSLKRSEGEKSKQNILKYSNVLIRVFRVFREEPTAGKREQQRARRQRQSTQNARQNSRKDRFSSGRGGGSGGIRFGEATLSPSAACVVPYLQSPGPCCCGPSSSCLAR